MTTLLFDVMGTLVLDPFFVEVPRFFGTDLKTLIATKHPTAWVDFELGEIDEDELGRRFFSDGRGLDVAGLKRAMVDAYAFLPGIEPLLAQLRARHVAMHVLSNYPCWYRLIEDKLALSRYLPWTFVSCHTRTRKPDASAYLGACEALGLAPKDCVFVDDRRQNCEAAREVGMDAIVFDDARALAAELARRGLVEAPPEPQ
jgi:FMN hydrolase / 5-amino-6-(5-phospho-D-ribitylamino)uracil phosphatase